MNVWKNSRLDSPQAQKLIPVFLTEFSQDVNHFIDACANTNWAEIKSIHHKLLGLSKTYGISFLVEALTSFKTDLSNENKDSADIMAERLVIARERLQQDYKRL